MWPWPTFQCHHPLKTVQNSIFGAVFLTCERIFTKLALMLCLEEKKSNEILMALTLFIWSHKYFVILTLFIRSHKYFVISTLTKIAFPHAITDIIRLILHLCNTQMSWLKFVKAYLQTQLTLFFVVFFFVLFGYVIVFLWKHCFNFWLLVYNFLAL